MIDVLEHLPDIVNAMAEVYRIGKHNSKVVVRVPYWNSSTAHADPTHIHYFDFETFNFFDINSWRYQARKYYGDYAFNLISVIFYTKILRRTIAVRNRFIKMLFKMLARHIGNIVQVIEAEYQIVKMKK